MKNERTSSPAQVDPVGRRRWVRLGAKTLHDVASITFGGALAACLVINQVASRESAAEFAAARQALTVIAQYLLVPSMGVVVLSGLLALAATRAYMNAGWAWLKALLGLAVFEATLVVVGSKDKQAAIVAAFPDPDLLDTLLRSERNTLWLLVVLCIINVVLAVWRPRLSLKVR
ncbi:MAG: hypothetical protein MUF44_16250 [Hydrogenophaga sp.]|jgi:hypothetical protein|nr:hypothetical protein [Hydrogenophaga sp.]